MFKRGNHIPIIGFLMLLAVGGCKRDTEASPDLGYNYVPLDVGRYIIYDVDSIVYNDFNGDTAHYRYQLKEVIESVFMDNAGRPTQRIERYIRYYNDSVPVDNIPWTISRVWSMTRTAAELERMEENQRYIRLRFPPREGQLWDGNVYNTVGTWNYKYKSVDAPSTILSQQFDSTLLVEQKNEINLINRRLYSERYARNIGLIEKEIIDVFDTTIVPGVPVVNRIAGGLVYSAKVVTWGRQ
jgi:hypothetical protein